MVGVKQSPPVVVSEPDQQAALAHLRGLPFRQNLPASWDRQRLMDLVREAIGRSPKVGAVADVAPEVFEEDYFVPVAMLALIVGGACGAVFASDATRSFALSFFPDLSPPLILLIIYGGGFVIGMLIAFLLVDVPTYLSVTLLRRMRPDLFARRVR